MRRSSSLKRSVATSLAKYGVNPLNRGLMRLGIRPPGTALLETTGRKSGKIRRNPVTDGLDDETTFWIVAEHGRHAGYVRNIEANPRVRVMVAGRWRTGTAHLLDDDDPRQRLRYIASRRPRSRVNAATVRLMQTELLTIRVDLDPAEMR
jgi:deazaflavin-dependent oxidoreductase (nitroreductase family)